MSLRAKIKDNPMLPLFWMRSIILRKLIFPLMSRNDGFNIFDEEWESLIVLDACRYDTFEKYYRDYIKVGRLEKRGSMGTETTSFLIENFGDTYHQDIVYVTANPFVDKLLKGKIYKIISVWKFGWDENYNTVLPSTMYAYTLHAIKRYPYKKFVVHFIQPHFPFIPLNITDQTFKELRDSALENRDPNIVNTHKALHRISSLDFYVKFEEKLLIKAYEANLKITLPYVAKLIDFLPGKTVITADHGETFGERLHRFVPLKVYGHPPDVPMGELTEVPWLIVEIKEKKEVDLSKELAKVRKILPKRFQEEEIIRSIVNKLRRRS